MKSILHQFASNKYRLTIFGLLAGASVFCVALLRLRASLTGSTHYTFLIWNLFLAWIPFGIAYVTYTTSIKRRWLYAVIPVSAFLWLIFFPNAPYILTDFQHLSYAGNDIPVWYDVIMRSPRSASIWGVSCAGIPGISWGTPAAWPSSPFITWSTLHPGHLPSSACSRPFSCSFTCFYMPSAICCLNAQSVELVV
jgi:hypothetical protein